MKIGTPVDKDSLAIKRSYKVLEVGPGSNPTKRADVLAEKFLEDNSHRRGGFRIYPNQKLVEADGENLPFADKEFDYVICSHVLEHVDDPYKFMKEQSRVAKMGYLEVPSLIGEWLAPKSAHKWVILEIDKKVVLYEKSRITDRFGTDFGDLFLNYLPYNSLLFRILTTSKQNFTTVRHEWKGDIDLIVNPQQESYSQFFTERWSQEMVKQIFPMESASKEIWNIMRSLTRFSFQKFFRVVNLSKKPVTLEDYRRIKNNG